MCITLYNEWIVDRRQMSNFRESFDVGFALINESGGKISA